jgi:hypothetical protein
MDGWMDGWMNHNEKRNGANSKMDSPRSIVYLLLIKPRFFFFPPVRTSSLSLLAKQAASSGTSFKKIGRRYIL